MTDTQRTLVEQHLSLASLVARASGHRVPLAFDELRSLALMGLCEAATTYDASRGVPFEAFAHRRMRGQIGDAIRAVVGRGPTKREPPLSLDALLEQQADTFAAPARDIVERLDGARAAARVRRLARAVDPRRRTVLLMRARGWSDAETGDALGLSAARVQQLRVEMGRRFHASEA